MEPVGLAVGLIGLAGLFNTCLDAAERIGSWNDYDTDYRSLVAQYNAQKLRLAKWGMSVGLEDDELSYEHHKLLDDPQTSATVNDLLLAINAVCRDEEKAFVTPAVGKEKQYLKDPLFQRPAPRESKRQKLKWALGTKAKRIAQVEQFSSLVENLYHLIPIEDNKREKGRKSTRDETLENKAWKNELREILQNIEIEMEDEIRRDIHAWLLGPSSSNELYEIFMEKRIEGTCDWVLSHSWFHDWTASHFPNERAKILWINGPAGFGKSVICARITEKLSSELEDPIAHFFFSSDFESRKDPFIAIRSWLSQLFRHPVVLALIRERWSGRPEQKATRGDTLKLLRDIVTAVPRCTFVLDGLDECSWAGDDQSLNDDNPIVGFLQALRRAVAATSTRILIVSRDEPEIRSCLSVNPDAEDALVYQHKIRPEDVQSDVEIFSRGVVDRKLSSRPVTAREDIARKLAERCNGQFLWVKMQEDHLRSGKSQKKLEQAISSTPPGLEHTYDRNWMRISNLPEDDRDRTVSLLRWAAFALRPLSISEITGALSISRDCDGVQLDELPDCIDEDYINTEILELCGSLVEIRGVQTGCDPGLRTVHLAHFSVKQYLLCNLTGQSRLLQANASLKPSSEAMENTFLARMCLCYVDCEDVWREGSNEAINGILSSFRDYAAGSWHRHASIGDIHDLEFVKLVNRLFDHRNVNWDSWKGWFDLNDDMGGISRHSSGSDINASDEEDSKSNASSGSDGSDMSTLLEQPVAHRTSTSPLYYASWLGLLETTDLLLQAKYPIDEQGNRGQTPLLAACQQGNLDMVKKFIDNGADMRIQNKYEHGPLRIAACYGHYEVTKYLLEKGADIAVGTPLLCAAESGHRQLVELLLEWGVDDNKPASDSKLNPTTTTVMESESCPALNKGVDIEVSDKEGRTALYVASVGGHVETARLLLSRGANVSCQTTGGWTPLNGASDKGFLEVVQLLLEHGADVHMPCGKGWTPLHSASGNGHTDIVDLLLHRGAKVNFQTETGWTALNAASENGFPEAVQLLLEKGADMEIATETGFTPVNTAASNGHTEVVRLLLSHGANMNYRTKVGWTPVSSASNNGFLDTTQLLLDEGADVDIPADYEWTALLFAVDNGHAEVVRLLLNRGAKVNSQTKFGWTSVNLASNNGNLEIVQLLLEKDADVEISAGNGWTPLLSASSNGYMEIARLLLDRGARINCQSETGWGPISTAADEGFLEIVQLLLEKGADIAIPTERGWTAILFAAHGGHTEIVRLLLNHGAEIECQNNYGWTPLIGASSQGHYEVVQFLLEVGANVNHVEEDGSTALMYASQRGDIEIMKLLLEAGADPNLANEDGETTLLVTPKEESIEVIKLLLEAGADPNHQAKNGFTSLIRAALNGHGDTVKLLLKVGANPNVKDEDGMTALMSAAGQGHLEMTKLLLEHDADITAADADGDTPLNLASIKGSSDIVKLCLDKGASVDAQGLCGWTPLIGASYQKRLGVAEILVENGANISLANQAGYSPFHAASDSGCLEVMKLLVKKLADLAGDQHPNTSEHPNSGSTYPQLSKTALDLRDNYGRMPLFYAAARGHAEMVEFLLAYSSPELKDRYGATPLFAAVRNGHEEVVKHITALQNQQASFEDGFGRNLLWWAKGTGKEAIVDLVYQFSKEIGLPASQASEGKACLVVDLDVRERWCDICTRPIPNNTSYLTCDVCNDFDSCLQCSDFKVQCLDASHKWSLRQPVQASSGSDEGKDKDSSEAKA